ncbi:Metallo-hydrolase/oxidoreductase [Crassisporium funariophilum]|nr:Metallo-hydrolase/oxidoreductase [Crassisporium funariophilum]
MEHSSKAAFHASRLTPTTFLIKEYDDIYNEHPHIYAKLIPSANAILIIDTGCGGATNDSRIKIKSLREFIEIVQVEENNGLPLNMGGVMEYVVALTHCHYDHILGVEDFKNSPILASAHSPSFLAKDVLPEHSLCKALGVKTPQFTPTLVPHLHPITFLDIPLGVTILHTPGHTPDEIALYDDAEMMLYVGDSLYEHEPIIFPAEGSIVTWFASMEYLILFVKDKQNATKRVLINSGHRTVLQPALDVLMAAKAFMEDVVAGREEVRDRRQKRGETTVTYEQAGGRFSLICPERLVEEARAMKEV